MASHTYTFIIVPDAKSQCKRFTFSTSIFSILGVVGIVLLIALGIVGNLMLGKYKAVSQKVEQVKTLQKMSVSQKNTIDRYEDDIAQLTNNLSYIKHLNSRLMILTGLNPEKGEQNLGLGGPENVTEEPDSTAKPKTTKK